MLNTWGKMSSQSCGGGTEGRVGSGSDKFNDDPRFTTALAWFSCVN